jgi:hypothetical protein
MNIKKQVLDELENTKFPRCSSRRNVSDEPIDAFVLGNVNYRGQKSVGGKTKGPSRYNEKFPKLYRLIKALIKEHNPSFSYTTIQVNKNVVSKPHVDKNNVGPYVIALGDFEGGNLVIKGKEYNIKNKWKKFDGTQGHWITPFEGTRYSLVFFTHTFKPPCPSLRNVKVTTRGLYKNDVLIEKYKNSE